MIKNKGGVDILLVRTTLVEIRVVVVAAQKGELCTKLLYIQPPDTPSSSMMMREEGLLKRYRTMYTYNEQKDI